MRNKLSSRSSKGTGGAGGDLEGILYRKLRKKLTGGAIASVFSVSALLYGSCFVESFTDPVCDSYSQPAECLDDRVRAVSP